MRRRHLAPLLLLPVLTGCAAVAQGLGSMAEGTGSRCVEYRAQVAAWSEREARYMSGKVATRDRSGRNVEQAEEAWVLGRMRSHENAGRIGTVTETSPHSGTGYQFRTTCSEWAS